MKYEVMSIGGVQSGLTWVKAPMMPWVLMSIVSIDA